MKDAAPHTAILRRLAQEAQVTSCTVFSTGGRVCAAIEFAMNLSAAVGLIVINAIERSGQAVFSMQVPETRTRGITLMISVLQNSTMRKCSEPYLLDQSF